jgi:hypothetical protein
MSGIVFINYAAATLSTWPAGCSTAGTRLLPRSAFFDVELVSLQDSSLRTFKGADENIYAVGFAPDGRTIVSGGADHDIAAPSADPKGAAQWRHGEAVERGVWR